VQHLIKQLAIGLNFEVEVEKELPEGLGSVDLLVKKGEKRFAFEISVTTSVEHEMENIAKCLKAKFDEVIVVALERGKLQKLRESATVTFPIERDKISFALAEDISSKLLELGAQSNSRETVTHGRKTRVAYKPLSLEEAKMRREALIQVTAKSLKKLKV
jgi:hypothetical protein